MSDTAEPDGLSPEMWLAVFLGNPGRRYEHTRHNAGFMAADAAAIAAGVRIDARKFHSLTAVCRADAARIVLMKPQTFMNLSGDAVRAAMNFYKLPLERVVAVSDDITLPLGALRVRRSGSAGGHNGLRDIIDKCGGVSFARIRIGVGSPGRGDGRDAADWVLSRVGEDEMPALLDAARRAASALFAVITRGVDKAMNDFNGDRRDQAT